MYCSTSTYFTVQRSFYILGIRLTKAKKQVGYLPGDVFEEFILRETRTEFCWTLKFYIKGLHTPTQNTETKAKTNFPQIIVSTEVNVCMHNAASQSRLDGGAAAFIFLFAACSVFPRPAFILKMPTERNLGYLMLRLPNIKAYAFIFYLSSKRCTRFYHV